MPYIDETKSIDFYNSRPGIHIGGWVLLFNREKAPSGKADIPLSVSAVRSLASALHLCSPLCELHPTETGRFKDTLHFVYIAPSCEDNFLDRTTLQEDEIEAAKFIPIAELDQYMKPYRVTAVNTFLANRTPGAMLYLEDGRLAGRNKRGNE